jgi:hypothetical protein
MRPLISVPLFTSACMGLVGCVGTNDEFQQRPYSGSYNGNAAIVASHRHPSQSRGHLYDQSYRSWQRNTNRANTNYWQNQNQDRQIRDAN